MNSYSIITNLETKQFNTVERDLLTREDGLSEYVGGHETTCFGIIQTLVNFKDPGYQKLFDGQDFGRPSSLLTSAKHEVVDPRYSK